MDAIDRLKRLTLGRALRSDARVRELSRGRSLAALTSDALSSNTYATQEILAVLAVGGFALYRFGPAIALAVGLVFVVIVAAYRNVVLQYPDGGADYRVAAANLGPDRAALTGAALLVDFSVTLAVSVAAAVDNLLSLVPQWAPHRIGIAVGVMVVLALLALRRSQVAGSIFVVGTFAFLAVVVVLGVVGLIRGLAGADLQAVSAGWELAPSAPGSGEVLTGLALVLVVTRAFASGSIAVTGVEAVGTSVPAFRAPRGPNAASALLLLGAVSMLLFGIITTLAFVTGVRYAEDPTWLVGPPPGTPQPSLMVQVGDAVLGDEVGGPLVGTVTILVLLAAGASAFRSFSVLSSVLAADGLLPRQLGLRGDRLVYSNGILLMGALAVMLLVVFRASLSALIGLYVIGVFLALTLGQAGMARHWGRIADAPRIRGYTREQRATARRGRLLARVAMTVAGLSLLAGLVAKLGRGAWLVGLVIIALTALMSVVRRHYDEVALDLAAKDVPMDTTARPSVTALILVARIHKPTLRALSYARATRPTRLEALTVAVDGRDADALQREWAERGIAVPLRVLESPFREISRPVLAYVASLRKAEPEGLLTIYLPEYVVHHWWERLLHNQSAARLKYRLRALPNVVVVSVPWQMAATGAEGAAPGGVTGAPAGPIPGPIPGGITGTTGALPTIEDVGR